MPEFLPVLSSRQDILPLTCRSCPWWLTSGGSPSLEEAEYTRRGEWMASLEDAWGSTGIMFQPDGSRGDSSSIRATAAIHFAPAARLPRLRDLPFGPLPPESPLIFCLSMDGGYDRPVARRLLQKALAQLRLRGAQEAFAFAVIDAENDNVDRCGFLPIGLLEDTGFKRMQDNRDLVLLRADLGGLASLLGQLQTAVKRLVGNRPAPSPAAWTRSRAT